MTGSKKLGLVQHRRCVLRIALALTLGASSALALGDSGQFTSPQVATDSGGLADLPIYPFNSVEHPVALRLTNNQRGLVRLLGLAKKSSADTTCVNSQSATSSSAPTQLPMRQPVPDALPLAQLAQLDCLNLPQQPQCTTSLAEQHNLPSQPGMTGPTSLAVQPLAHEVAQLVPAVQPLNLPPASGSSVVMATATLPAQYVQERFSDSSMPSNGLDLVGSLDPITRPSAQESSAVITSLSDRDEAADTSTNTNSIDINLTDKQPSSPEPTDRQPQLVKPRHGMSVQQLPVPASLPTAAESNPVGGDPTRNTPSHPTLNVVNQEVSSTRFVPLPVDSGAATASTGLPSTENSTRVDNGNRPLNLRVEGGPGIPQPVSKPLPILANSKLKARPVAIQSTPQAAAAPTTDKRIAIAVKDSVPLQSKLPIQAVSVEHEEVCQVVQNGQRTYSVIGLREGETRIALVSDTAAGRQIEVHSVIVGSQRSSSSTATNLANEISQTVRQLYPRSRVRISQQEQQLIVSGSVESEETAKAILSLIRKSTLTPVVDQLVVR